VVDIMDRGQMNNPQLARERAVYDYLESLENGDIDGIILSLQRAVYDAPLDQMLIDAHQTYFQEEQQEEQSQSGVLADTPTDAHLPPLGSLSPRARTGRQKRHAFPVWARALAAVLLFGVLVGSFATVLIWRQAASNATPAPARSSCTALKLYPAPNHGKMPDLLNAVTVVGSQDAWAVGYSVVPQYQLAPTRTLIEHWNGQRWQIIGSPNGKLGNELPANGILNAVAAVSANDVWSVGSYQARTGGAGDQHYEPLIEHWNGFDWQVVPSPDSPASRGPNSPSGNGKLSAIAVVSANDIWAAGQAVKADGNFEIPLLEHWNGKNWSLVSDFPATGSTVLNGLAVVSSRDIWVAGGKFTSTTSQGLIAHWNGSRWELSTAFPGIFAFTRLSAHAPDDIWALGTLNASDFPQVEHWDGKKWSVVPLPQLASAAVVTVFLSGITAVTASDVWAVGTLRVNGQEEQFLVLHWNGKTWQRVKIQVPQPRAHNTANAIAIGYNQTWIVGDSDGLEALIQGCA
jgi:hypothetical protein